ncbi:MAG: response regulator, partial [Pseudomonadales bacterium]|nr:response regulator [Pseudomonadales bacterium]
KGTVFTIVLYDAITQQLSATSLDSKQLATAFDVSGMRVLVAEDNPVNQKIIAKLLRDMKLDVTLVENGALAVEAVRQSIATQAQDYAAVLLDIEMPVLDGIAAAMNIKQLLGDHAPQLIALTAHAAQENSHRFREAGFSFILEKPVSRELLQETLYQAFLAQLDSVSG